jgi:spore coat protein U-like protein
MRKIKGRLQHAGGFFHSVTTRAAPWTHFHLGAAVMNRNRLLVVAAVVALVGAAFFVPIHLSAGTAVANLAVSATVAANCTIADGTLAFGNYDPIVANASSDLDKTGTFTVTCTKNGANIYVGAGNGGNFLVNRRLKSGTDYLNYEMYTSVGRITPWGTTLATGLAVVPNGKTAVTMTVYGRIPANQDQPIGSYTDTVVMTVNF